MVKGPSTLNSLKKAFGGKSKLTLDNILTDFNDLANLGLKDAKEDILNIFHYFFEDYTNKTIEYKALSNEYACILDSTRLDLGLRVKSNQYYTISSVTNDYVFIVYKDIITNEAKSDKIPWDKVPKVSYDIEDINLKKAIKNLAKRTSFINFTPEYFINTPFSQEEFEEIVLRDIEENLKNSSFFSNQSNTNQNVFNDAI